MHVGSWWFLGMHVFWWIFWVALLIWAFRWAMSMVKRQGSAGREAPLDILKRKHAAGEITMQEYEVQRATLTRDREVA